MRNIGNSNDRDKRPAWARWQNPDRDDEPSMGTRAEGGHTEPPEECCPHCRRCLICAATILPGIRHVCRTQFTPVPPPANTPAPRGYVARFTHKGRRDPRACKENERLVTVRGVTYSVFTRQDGGESLLATYTTSDGEHPATIKHFIGFTHAARGYLSGWWTARAGKDSPVPTSAREAVSRSDELKTPYAIRIEEKPGERWPTVRGAASTNPDEDPESRAWP